MSYTNADGLFILTDGAQGAVGGEGVTARASRQTIVVDITAANTGSSFGSSNIDPLAPQLPAGSIIVNADLVVTTPFASSGGGTLTIGTYNAAGTAIDADTAYVVRGKRAGEQRSKTQQAAEGRRHHGAGGAL